MCCKIKSPPLADESDKVPSRLNTSLFPLPAVLLVEIEPKLNVVPDSIVTPAMLALPVGHSSPMVIVPAPVYINPIALG